MDAPPDSLPVWILDGIMLLVVLEACLFAWGKRRRGRARAFAQPWFCNLLSGFCLLAALRLVLGGATSWTVLLALSGAFAAHLLDIHQRNRLP
jgi:hypothetical protein